MDILPKLPADETLHISSEGLENILKNYDPQNPFKNFLWTTDFRTQLPVRVKKSGFGSETPITICQLWNQFIIKQYSQNNAICYEKSQNNWVYITYHQYYQAACIFAKALIGLGITNQSTVNIIGFNSPEWAFSFLGSILGGYIPVGIYTTNGPDACQYICNHSQCQIIIVQNRVQLKKYMMIIEKIPQVKYFIIYKEQVPQQLPTNMLGKVFSWSEFMNTGLNMYKGMKTKDQLQYRMKIQKPGNCCSFIYTSGTTGPPKAVMISHDNYTWTCEAIIRKFNFRSPNLNGKGRALSLLPLSHVAAQLSDLIVLPACGGALFFADPTALQGNLLKFLLVCRPTVFLSVPRIWEKMEEKLSVIGAQTTGIKRYLADWAKQKAIQGTYAQKNGLDTPRMWSIAKKLIFDKIKENLGLDKCQHFIYSAAPLRQSTKRFFLNINILLESSFGMSQLSGPHTFTDVKNWPDYNNKDFLKETGVCIEGLQLIIDNPDLDGNGQICLRGRNKFMGYFKNQDQTKNVIDNKGFVHSGDIGRLDSRGNLLITGRIKQLIITAGGQNVAPILIENQINSILPIFSQVVVIGDKRKYLTALLTLKVNENMKLSPQVIEIFKQKGSLAKTIEQAIQCKNVKRYIDEGMNTVNEKAISKAQKIIKFTILPNQFSIDGGQLTPTLKLKRKVIAKMYENQIQGMYLDPKL